MEPCEAKGLGEGLGAGLGAGRRPSTGKDGDERPRGPRDVAAQVSVPPCALRGSGSRRREGDGEAGTGVSLPCPPSGRVGRAAPRPRVNGPIGFVCWSV